LKVSFYVGLSWLAFYVALMIFIGFLVTISLPSPI